MASNKSIPAIGEAKTSQIAAITDLFGNAITEVRVEVQKPVKAKETAFTVPSVVAEPANRPYSVVREGNLTYIWHG